MKVAILGSGAFGGAISKLLERRNHDIHLWSYREDEAREIRETRRIPNLPALQVGPGVHVTHDLEEAVAGAPIVFQATPVQGIRAVLRQAVLHLDANAIVINGSKGIEVETLSTVEDVFREVLPAATFRRAVYFSGPTFAAEIARDLPAALLGASRDHDSLKKVKSAFTTERFHIFDTTDTTGVCLAGALKNVYAIAAGASDTLGLGTNARAALVSRSLAELSHLGVKMGADPITFLGLAGLGDLVLTCTGDLSRNRRLGMALGEGSTAEEAFEKLHGVAEGYFTAKAMHSLASKCSTHLPIAALVYQVLYEGLDIEEAVHILLSLDTFHEFSWHRAGSASDSDAKP